MSFDSTEFLITYSAGEPVHISQQDFGAMEDTLVQAYLPVYGGTRESTRDRFLNDWQHRNRLLDIVRDKGFLGQLIDPVVQRIDDPLLAMEQSIVPDKRRLLSATNPDNIIGLQLSAEIKSTRRDMHGSIARPIWYIRHPEGKQMLQTTNFWRRVLGANTADNNIADILAQSRRSGSHTVISSGHRASRRRR